jgi:hypothetical protein
MLVLLEQNLADECEKLSEKELNYLDELLFYHSKFFHYVAATRRTALDLGRKLSEKLSQRSLLTLKVMTTQANDLPRMLDKVKFYAVVRYSEMAGGVIQHANGKKLWVCDLEYASKWFSQPSALIGEHLTDTKIFRAASEDFSGEYSIDPRMQKFGVEMSGGSGNAPAVIKNRVLEATRPVICVIDSDKLSVDSSSSDSVAKCQAMTDELGGISHFVVLSERELENLLPNPIVQAAINELPVSHDRDSIQDKFEVLNSLRATHPTIYSYIDVKNGTCRTWAKDHKVDKFFMAAPVIAICNCHKDCDGIIAPGLFKDVLNKAADFVEKQSPRKIFSVLKNEPREEWLRLGGTVLSFGLSNNIRTI